MPKDEQEFLTYLAKHFRLVESVCANLKGFESDSELHAFLQDHSQEAEAPKRQATFQLLTIFGTFPIARAI